MRKSLWRGAIAALAGLALLEAGLRWGVGLGQPPLARLDPVTEYELLGPAQYRRWGNRIEINAAGLRMGPLEPVTETTRRVLVIGDSVIYGGHFLDQPETIAAGMTRALNAAPDLAGCALAVLPVAVSSWGPANQAAFLKRDGTFEAVAAGIVLSGHDLYDTPQAGTQILPYRTRAPIGAIGDAVEAVLERTLPRASFPQPPFEERASRSLGALDEMVRLLRSAAIEPILFYHPTMSERAADTPSRQADIFRSWAEDRNIAYSDLGAITIDRTAYQDDIHPTAEGAGILADALSAALRPAISPC